MEVKGVPTDPLQALAWRDCLMWAAGEVDVRERFLKESGVSLPSSPFEQLIDASTGHDQEIAERFIAWFNENVWGET